MKSFLAKFKNRYIISTVIALVYAFVLHNTDAYTVIERQHRVAELEMEIETRKSEIEQMKTNIANLQDLRSLEKYARETHLFKKADEEIFIFSFE